MANVGKRGKGTSEFVRWMPPLLQCLKSIGGSAKPREVTDWIIRELKLSPDVTEATLKSGQTRFYNQVHWARQYLVWDGLIDDTKRGVWTLTPLGWKSHLDDASARELFQNRVRNRPATQDSSLAEGTAPTTPAIEERPPLNELQEQTLLDTLKSLPSYGFELVCERLLREHGFEEVEVTQKSRDGGIDGFGTLRLSPFVSMKVAFQAKRYKGSVSRQEVGQFRNDLLGRAEKGVLITTGKFTRDAEEEASKAGATPIELIDGQRLVELFEERQLGVKPKQIYEIDESFFDQFRNK